MNPIKKVLSVRIYFPPKKTCEIIRGVPVKKITLYHYLFLVFSSYMMGIVNDGTRATIEVSAAGYISLSEERSIRPDLDFQAINIFPSPELSDGEHRVVLSWVTKTDLDIYVLQIDK